MHKFARAGKSKLFNHLKYQPAANCSWPASITSCYLRCKAVITVTCKNEIKLSLVVTVSGCMPE